MSRLLRSLALASAISLGHADAQDLVGVSWSGNVYSLDSSTGAGTMIGNLGAGAGCNAMATDTAGNVYISQRIGVTTPYSWQLVTIDPATATSISIVATFSIDIRGLAFDTNNNLYAIIDQATTASGFDELFLLQPQTQTAISIGATGRTGLQGFAIRGSQFFAWDIGNGQSSDLSAGLMSIDPLTGAATDVNASVGPVGGADVQFLAVRADGTLIGGRDALYSIDHATGAFTLIGSGGYVDLRGADVVNPCTTSYGNACAGSGGFVPVLQANNCPVANAPFSLKIDDALGGSTAVLLLGLGQGSIPLGFGCFLNVSPVLPAQVPIPLGGVGPGNGNSTITAPIPGIASGFTFTLQAIIADPGVPKGFSATAGLELKIQ